MLNHELNNINKTSGELLQFKLDDNNSQLPKQYPTEIHESHKEIITQSDSKENSYTIKDLSVFQGRLYKILVRYDDVAGLMSEMNLRNELAVVKEDFYNRFRTTEKHLRTHHPGLFQEAKSTEEEMDNRSRFLPYAKLKYSIE